MSSPNDSNTTPSMFAVDFLIGIAAILYITNIAPIFFTILLCTVLSGAIIGIVLDCRKWQ